MHPNITYTSNAKSHTVYNYNYKFLRRKNYAQHTQHRIAVQLTTQSITIYSISQ
jgi:hypothetical protein